MASIVNSLELNRPASNSRTVKVAMMAKKVPYSRLMADFQEKGRDGGRQFLNLGE